MYTKQSDDPRKVWVDAKDTSSLQRCFTEDKQTLLTTIYSALYAELRDRDGRQQQAVTWGLTMLTGSSLIGMFAGSKNLTPFSCRDALRLVISFYTGSSSDTFPSFLQGKPGGC